MVPRFYRLRENPLQIKSDKALSYRITRLTDITTVDKSEKLFKRACDLIPGGVNSPVRAFAAVGGTPPFITGGQGAHLLDSDGKKYIDYIDSWGATIMGHAHPEVLAAVTAAAKKGLSFGMPTEAELLLAEKICNAIDSIEMVRMVNSGTEATMSAVRLARGFTGRDLIVKFDGCYHGHSDTLLSGAGSGALALGIPNSPGVPEAIAEQTVVLDYNEPQQIHDIFKKTGDKIAAIIVEPVAGNMNLLPGSEDFLRTMRECCDKNGALLIFDEVMSGFRVAWKGAQSLYDIKPDLTTLGKVIGGGMPVGAFGGAKNIMQHLAPAGTVYQAGTLSGNPVAMAAGLKTLELLGEAGVLETISSKTADLSNGLRERADAAGVPFFCHNIGAMFGFFFTSCSPEQGITRFEQVKQCNDEHFKRFFHLMLEQGVFFAPSLYEAGFVSAAHSDDDIQLTVSAAEHAFNQL